MGCQSPLKWQPISLKQRKAALQLNTSVDILANTLLINFE